MQVYIPHITGGYTNLIDYLEVDNTNADDASFNMVLLDGGYDVVYSGTLMNALAKLLIGRPFVPQRQVTRIDR
jgi:hypothetical protein